MYAATCMRSQHTGRRKSDCCPVLRTGRARAASGAWRVCCWVLAEAPEDVQSAVQLASVIAEHYSQPGRHMPGLAAEQPLTCVGSSCVMQA